MIAAIIQARVGSQRLRNKIFKKVDGIILLKLMIERVKLSKNIDKIIISTTNKKEDIKIINFCKKNKISFFRGHSQNVMKRYVDTATYFNIQTIIRLTGDCPLVDSEIIDKMIEIFHSNKIDYLSNTCPPNKSKYPDGSDVEIFKSKNLRLILKKEKRKEFLEHVTHNFWKENNYKIKILNNYENWSNFRYTLDYYEDFLVLSEIIKYFKKRIYRIKTKEIVKFLKKNKYIFNINKQNKIKAINWKK